MRLVSAVAAAAVLAALAAGVGVIAASALQTEASATTVKVTKKEWGLIPAVRRAAPGKVTFVVRNVGKLDHSFVVLRTDRRANSLPVKGAKAVEIGLRGKLAAFRPGQTRGLTLTLKPGKYVLICNVPGHYKAGQFASFRVT